MCGRYFVNISEDELKAAIAEAEAKLLKEHMQIKIGEVFPTDIAAVRTKKSGYMAMKWGFTMGSAKSRPVINARSEEAKDKPFFGYGRHRCIIPASNYFEWEKAPDRKIKHTLSIPDEPVIFMAGLCRMEKDEEIPRFVVLTRPAAPGIAYIHDRMPVIIPRNRLDEWLDRYDVVGDAIDDEITSLEAV